MTNQTLQLILSLCAIAIGIGIIWRMVTLRETIEPKWYLNKNIMIPIAAFLILRGVYVLITPADRYELGGTKWSLEDRNILTENCLRDAAQKSVDYPDETREYCECTTNSITRSLTIDEYIANTQEPMEHQMQLIMPLIQKCLDELNTKTMSSTLPNKM